MRWVGAPDAVAGDLHGHQTCPTLDPDPNLINCRLRLLHVQGS
jgi:hypothetical protein